MKAIVLAVVLCVFTITGLSAQPLSTSYPFTISSFDSVTQTMLPGASRKIPILSRISIVDGHFMINAATTQPERIRLFGTELWLTSNFMDGQHAAAFAKHLRKLGFNALRLSFNDYPYYGLGSGGALCYAGADGSYTVDSGAFAMMDTLIHELSKNGIYTFLRLHSYHYFTAADGVAQPDTVHGFSQFVHFIDNRAAELHRKWAKTLLTHVSPLSKKRIADDPAVAAIEIAGDQEFSLLAAWRYNYLNYTDDANVITNGGTSTIGYHRSRRLDTLFTQYLLRKYGTQNGINSAWMGKPVINPPNLVDNGSFEQIGSAAWSFALQNGATGDKSLFGSAADSQFCTLFLLSKLSANPSYADAYALNTSVRLKKDSLYEMKFWAKIRYNPATPVLNRSLYIVLNNTQTGANSLAQTPTIDTAWKQYTFNFRSMSEGSQYLYFFMGTMLGDVMLDGVSIKQRPEVGLLPGETTTAFMIGRVTFAATIGLPFQRYRDMFLFYDSLQTNYFTGVSKCIKDTIKSAMLVNNYCPVYWGTYVDAWSNRNSDFTGGGINRDYPYYSARPIVTDSSWRILNSSVLNDLYAGTLGRPVAQALEGKPFILSSYWTPSVNQHHHEIPAYFAAYASLQDWDGMFIGPYAYYRQDLDSDFVQRGGRWWAINGTPSILSQLPVASDAFRNFKIAPASTKVTIARDNDDLLLWGVPGHLLDPYGVEGGLDLNIATQYKIRGSFGATVHKIGSEYPYLAGDTSTKVSETEEIKWSQTQQWFLTKTPKFENVTGYFINDTIAIGTMKFARLDGNLDELSLSMTSLDSFDLARSSNLFLSVGTRSQNTGWKWSGDTAIFNNWGAGPTLMSAASLKLYVRSDSLRVIVHPLDEQGRTTNQSIDAVKMSDTNIFTVTIDGQVLQSPWYWIEMQGTPTSGAVGDIAAGISSLEVYPNPVSTSATVQLTLSQYSKLKISVYDVLGRERLIAAEGELSEGAHTLSLLTDDLEAGHYILRCETPTGKLTTSVVVVK